MLFPEGHGFSRAAKCRKLNGALAPGLLPFQPRCLFQHFLYPILKFVRELEKAEVGQYDQSHDYS